MDFDIDEFVELIKKCNPTQVNIGYNTNYSVTLSEPSDTKIKKLINRLKEFTHVHLKKNSHSLKSEILKDSFDK